MGEAIFRRIQEVASGQRTPYLALDIPGIILFKVCTITLVFYILLRDSLKPCKNVVIAVVILAASIFMILSRFVERPDMFLMLFLSFSILSLHAFLYDNRKYLYVLPLVHMLWANTHTSLVLMVIPFMAFIGGGILQLLINRFYGSRKAVELFPSTPPVSKLLVAALVFLISYGATFVTPYQKGFFMSPQFLSGAQFISTARTVAMLRTLTRTSAMSVLAR